VAQGYRPKNIRPVVIWIAPTGLIFQVDARIGDIKDALRGGQKVLELQDHDTGEPLVLKTEHISACALGLKPDEKRAAQQQGPPPDPMLH